MIRSFRITRWLMAMLVGAASASVGLADEQHLASPQLGYFQASVQTPALVKNFTTSLNELTRSLHSTRIDLPRRPRVSRTHRPFREVTLVGGDKFVGECLDWGTQVATFRLQNSQIVSIAVAAVSRMANSPGEVDLFSESFEPRLPEDADSKIEQMRDATQAASGQFSLRIDSTSGGFRHALDKPLNSVRIEFLFQSAGSDLSSSCGEWQLEWDHVDPKESPLVVRVGADRSISLVEAVAGSKSSQQTLRLAEGWHSFVALMTPGQTRLIVDDAILASISTPRASFKAIQFRPAAPSSENRLWIDDLQIQKTGNSSDEDLSVHESIDRDMLVTESGDELFGRIIGVTENGATLETLGRIRSIPFRGVTALNWQQPSMAVRQLPAIKAGVIARITMQPFVDRPACEPEQFTVTITRSDSMYLVVQHELIGEMKLRWSDISRVDPLFFGQSVLIDARRFHLGNSIRSDFHRHLPDGMRLHGEFSLPTIPPGRPSLSLDVAELEAAGPGTPPASPFLASLRAGNLVTEVIVNDRLLGNLNEQIRFKPPIKTPERIRIAVPREFLKQGQNSFELLQKPLTKGGQEFDDSEIGNIRLDFEFSQD